MKYQYELIAATMDTYISTVNRRVSDAVSGISIVKYTSRHVDAKLGAMRIVVMYMEPSIYTSDMP